MTRDLGARCRLLLGWQFDLPAGGDLAQTGAVADPVAARALLARQEAVAAEVNDGIQGDKRQVRRGLEASVLGQLDLRRRLFGQLREEEEERSRVLYLEDAIGCESLPDPTVFVDDALAQPVAEVVEPVSICE
jgi:hypothetical protein